MEKTRPPGHTEGGRERGTPRGRRTDAMKEAAGASHRAEQGCEHGTLGTSLVPKFARGQSQLNGTSHTHKYDLFDSWVLKILI